MDRAALIGRLSATAEWDVIIIGGGATGLGSAVEAASRGYRTLLLEQNDFAKATSSRATKLSHGGVRYLQQGNLPLVFGALHERGLMIRNAPHLVHPLSFVIPTYKWWEKAFYGIGLEFYELLAGKLSLGRAEIFNRAKMRKEFPTVRGEGLRGGVLYHDGQFDDSRLAITLLRTFDDLGGTALNYFGVVRLLKQNGKVAGVVAKDTESGQDYEIKARAVLNATGIFTDSVRHYDDPSAPEMLSVSQGTHIILDRSFFPGDRALMIPKTEDGRVLFAVPWHDHVIVGTTDIGTKEPLLEPRALPEEIEFLLHHTNKYLNGPVSAKDVLSIFSGLRPLVKASGAKNTAKLSRDHTIVVSPANLVSIAGGKWTTYRHMGEDAINQVAEVGGLAKRPCVTRELHLHGWTESDTKNVYGSDAPELEKLIQADPTLGERLDPALPYRRAEVVWGVRYELARTVEDVLSRRTRSLLLNARASIAAAPVVARLMAKELGRDTAWEQDQINSYKMLASGYLLP